MLKRERWKEPISWFTTSGELEEISYICWFSSIFCFPHGKELFSGKLSKRNSSLMPQRKLWKLLYLFRILIVGNYFVLKKN